jgi:hypothetical protein
MISSRLVRPCTRKGAGKAQGSGWRWRARGARLAQFVPQADAEGRSGMSGCKTQLRLNDSWFD